MFGKKTKKRIADLEAFEKGVCKVIDGYFKTNTQAELRYSMDNAVDKFWHFVKSVDDRLKDLSKEIAKKQSEIDEKDEFLGKRNDCIDKLQKTVAEQHAVINAQEKETETLAKAKGGKK